MKLLVVSGGRHPYEETTPILKQMLINAGHEVEVTDESSILSRPDELHLFDVLVFNTLRIEDKVLKEDEQMGMKDFISGGKGFVCIHISGCIPDEWTEYRQITGGGWVMDTSYHPPFGNVTVNIEDNLHPGVEGVSDFSTNDELYMGMEYSDDNHVFITADSVEGHYLWRGESMFMSGGTFPLGWTRNYGEGRVFVTLLGHNGLSFKNTEFQRIILNGVQWAAS